MGLEMDRMTAKRFDYTAYDDGTESIYDRKKDKYYFDMQLSEIEELMNELAEEKEQLKSENKELKFRNEELLYQIGYVGKNNKTCRECECFIPEIKYCYMWDMEVEADDVVVACDQRKVKKYKGGDE